MKQEIKNRILELGGEFDFRGESLERDIGSIFFKKSFFNFGFEDYLPDELYKKIREEGIISESEIKGQRIRFQSRVFTPFKKGTEDYKEWYNGLNEVEAYVKSVIKSNTLDFMIIGESDSFPDCYFICLSDENIENPIVYSTDHEVFFDEITIEGTLEDYFKMFVSSSEYQLIMEKLVEELKME